MKRRHFLLAMSALSAAAAAPAKAKPAPSLPDSADLQQITRSIEAHFGGGFELRSARVEKGRTVCIIENRGNRLRVSSSDAARWAVEGATPM